VIKEDSTQLTNALVSLAPAFTRLGL